MVAHKAEATQILCTMEIMVAFCDPNMLINNKGIVGECGADGSNGRGAVGVAAAHTFFFLWVS